MHQYIARRLVLAVPTVGMMLLLIFFILRILPGDVAEQMLLGPSTGGNLPVSRDVVEAMRRNLGIDKPLHTQFLTWVGDTLRGDFGRSLYSGESVWSEIGARIPITLQIAVGAQLVAILLGVPIGVITAIKQDSWPDYVLRLWSIMFLAIPAFWLGLMVLLGGLIFFHWSPPVGRNVIWETPGDTIQQIVWPVLILGLISSAVLARMTRSSTLEVLREDYVRTARSKGLAEWVVITRHVLKNALIPVITLIGTSFGNLVAGTVILERVFTVPGMGNMYITAILQRDYPIVQATVFLVAISFVTINLIVDLLYGWLDPRISYK